MPLRSDLTNPLAGGGILGIPATGMTHDGITDVDPTQLLDPDDNLVHFLHLHLPGLMLGTSDHPRLGKTVTVADVASLAQAALTPKAPASWPVLQRASHPPWDTPEHAVRRWHALDRPHRTR